MDSALYLDLRVSYDFAVGDNDCEVFGMVTNLTDRDPPVTPYHSVFEAHPIQTNSVLFDLLRRRYTIRVKFRM